MVFVIIIIILLIINGSSSISIIRWYHLLFETSHGQNENIHFMDSAHCPQTKRELEILYAQNICS